MGPTRGRLVQTAWQFLRREWWLPFLAFYIVESLLFVAFGRVARDEGWYLYAGWMVRQGKLPYLDFPYFQAPLLPVVHSLLVGFPGTLLEAGRLVSLGFGVSTAVLVADAARRLAGSWAAVLSLLGFVTSSYALYHLNYAGNLAPSGCLAFLAAYLLIFGGNRLTTVSAAVVSAVLASAIRLSFAPYVVTILGVALWRYRRNRRAMAVLLTCALSAFLVCFGPFLLAAPEKTLFNLFFAQALRHGQFGTISSRLTPPVWQWGFTSFSFFAFGVGTFVIAVILRTWRREDVPHERGTSWSLVYLTAAALVVYLPNLVPGDAYPNYVVAPLPFMACVGGAGTVLAWRRFTSRKRMLLLIWLLFVFVWGTFASVVYLPRVMSLISPQRQVLREVGSYLAANVPPSRPVFTFETPLAVAARRNVVSGQEMSYFSFFPYWPTTFCQKYDMLNDELVGAKLASEPLGAVVVTDFDLFLLRDRSGRPEQKRPDPLAWLPELRDRYYLARSVPDFGLFGDNLYILLPKNVPTKEISASS